MYDYPITPQLFEGLVQIDPVQHSMGESLETYLKLKIHPYLTSQKFDKIKIIGKFDRTTGISANEKTGKLFNWIRPTAFIDEHILELRCFPGQDYVYHYANIVKTFMSAYSKDNTPISYDIPTEEECWQALKNSGLDNIPKVKTVVMGYVEGLEFLSMDQNWQGQKHFLYKRISEDAILLGCQHTYWGEIAGRIVVYLSMLGVRKIIYSGKLGTLNASITPNTLIATGNTSILPNGEIITWKNIFGSIHDPLLSNGIHITLPSVLQETKDWVEHNKTNAAYVDPEIGHMAYAAKQQNIRFSYLHIISDNLSMKYEHDLSNERDASVLEKRKILLNRIGDWIKTAL